MTGKCIDCKFLQKPFNPRDPHTCMRFPPHMELMKESWLTQFTIIGSPQVMWCGEFKTKIVLADTIPQGTPN